MKRRATAKNFLPVTVALLALRAESVWACAACYGQSDSPLAQGMNWGIFSLLGVIVGVLTGITTFFVVLSRKSAAVRAVESDASQAKEV
jgi:heme/copper-type cytochrome/quinol oxidase subunit 2